MTARIQGCLDDWHFSRVKTASYRQIGNAVALRIKQPITGASSAKDLKIS